jgi:hypothetical protein
MPEDLSLLMALLDLRHRAFDRVLGCLPEGVCVRYVSASEGLVQVSGVLDGAFMRRLLEALDAAAAQGSWSSPGGRDVVAPPDPEQREGVSGPPQEAA